MKENRRQENNMEYAKVLNQIRTGGFPADHKWAGIGVTELHETKDVVAPEVRHYFVNAYVRGWGRTGATVDPDDSPAMTSYRRDCDKWNGDMVK